MARFILRRLALAVPTLLGVLVVAFLLLYVAPGDPVTAMLGQRADPATVARLRAELHLDDPLPVRFARYADGVLHGRLGRSYVTDRPITADIAERFPKTLELAAAAMLLATTCGITL
ncbi:MAG: ABC transporter permease, partial [Gemmatimonadota bacterium]|nr:ABC transporter permease [Gemmatimonadota bacterium]